MSALYAWLAKWALQLGVVAVLLIGTGAVCAKQGYDLGKSRGEADRAKTERALSLMTSSRDSWQVLADSREAAITAQNQAHAAALKRAQMETVKAEATVARANAAAEKFLRAKADLERLAAHDAHGDCADWAKEHVCGSPLR